MNPYGIPPPGMPYRERGKYGFLISPIIDLRGCQRRPQIKYWLNRQMKNSIYQCHQDRLRKVDRTQMKKMKR